MTKETLTKADLAQFTGTEKWYRHPLVAGILYTDGIQYVANAAGAYWLIDEIAFKQQHPRIVKEEFQVWTLKVDLEQSTAILTCEDGNYNVLYQKKIHYTDFPLDEIVIYCINKIILLWREY